jgi:HEAT repeat-containing taxis protein
LVPVLPVVTASTGQLVRRGDIAGLVARASDPRRRARLAAVTALRSFPGDESEAALMRALDDESFFIALVALGSLAAIDDDRDPEPIVRALRRRIARDENELIRAIGQPDESAWKEPNAIEITQLGLWRLRRVDAVPKLLAALDGGSLAGEEPLVPAMRARAVRALGEIGDSAATPAVRRALRDADMRVRRAALDALASIGGEEAVLALRDDARRGRFLDRLAARRALRRAEKGDPPGTP